MRSKTALAIAALLACGAGCEQILGLNDFTKVDAAVEKCDAATCDDGGMADATNDVQTLDVVFPDVVNQASSWANGPMPSSPAEIEAGANPASLASFVAADAGADAAVVFDNVGKKLYWNLASSATAITDVQSAAAYCSSLGPQWRLPTRIELVTLLDSTTASAAHTSLTGANLQADRYWTSSYVRPVSPNGLQYWAVDFSTGDVGPMPQNKAYVICTTGGT